MFSIDPSVDYSTKATKQRLRKWRKNVTSVINSAADGGQVVEVTRRMSASVKDDVYSLCVHVCVLADLYVSSVIVCILDVREPVSRRFGKMLRLGYKPQQLGPTCRRETNQKQRQAAFSYSRTNPVSKS